MNTHTFNFTYSRNSYSSGSGIGSLTRSSTVRAALAGAAAGVVTYTAGRAILGGLGYLAYGGRNYYYGGYYPYVSEYKQ